MNENCLAGMRCPKRACKSEGPFAIVVAAIAEVHDDGTEEFSDVEWDDDSYCRCKACGYEGIVADFERRR